VDKRKGKFKQSALARNENETPSCHATVYQLLKDGSKYYRQPLRR